MTQGRFEFVSVGPFRWIESQREPMQPKLLRLGYAAVVLKGVFAAIAPKTTFSLVSKTWSLGLENVEELEPREWYVNAIRATGVGMIAAGLAGIALVGSDEAAPEDVEPIDVSPDDE
jgi:hypothetical protein